jgi:wyosine [tRNA(Phe)-imidazoG37] synthetase (radical SAM superfamily)
MAEEQKYLYGPVPSRRLGLSLGVDIMPLKVCTLDCVYCQLGKSGRKTVNRKEYVSIDAVLGQLKSRLAEPLEAEHVTVGGSGEPTLHSGLGELVGGIKELTTVPAAIITNGTLLYRPDVRADCARADVVLPSLDAGDEETFRKINRPHADISIEKLIAGLCAFREEFAGQIWLEIFLVESVNTADEQIDNIKKAIEAIRPDKVQLNTAVRPTAEREIKSLSYDKLQAIAVQLGREAEVIAEFSSGADRHVQAANDQSPISIEKNHKTQSLLAMLKRRPCSISDICSALGISPDQARKDVGELKRRGAVSCSDKDGTMFFEASQH